MQLIQMIILASIGNTLGDRGQTGKRKTNMMATTVTEAKEDMSLT